MIMDEQEYDTNLWNELKEHPITTIVTCGLMVLGALFCVWLISKVQGW